MKGDNDGERRDGLPDDHAHVHEIRYDPASEDDIALTIVGHVADVADVDPLEMAPLHESIDTDALNRLFDPGGRASGLQRLTFSFEGYTVTVTESRITIVPE
jgi:hypothetical protein